VEIYIGNLPWGATEAELRELCAAHGAVEKVSMILDKATGEPRGFAFVTMADEEAAKAIAALDGTTMRGRQLRVNPSRSKGRTA
jgi:RNA recognition motif-containing protein